MVNSCGKILFYGGYSVLLKDHVSLSLGVVDRNRKGVFAKWKEHGRKLISPQFGLDFEPSTSRKEMINYAYLVAERYLKEKGYSISPTIELHNSSIFGNEEEKSGLGSSAAAVCSVIKAMFESNSLDYSFHSETIFKLSQLAYALYSNKIGSGFDIATSSFNSSIIYYRYDPSEIVLSLENVSESIDKPWKWVKIKRFLLPSYYKVIFFNIKGGKTSTISAVKGFKAFKERDRESFDELMSKQNQIEREAINSLEKGEDEKVKELTNEARAVHREMQDKIRKIMPAADYIEPPPLTHIIDESEKLEGVIAGRCPGAGGWDGVAFIVHEEFKEIEKIIEIGRSKGLELYPIDLVTL